MAAFKSAFLAAAIFFLSLLPASGPARAASFVLVAFGDSLTAGYGLPEKDGFVPRLEAALKAKGLDVNVVNGGVSGDTTSGGLARLDWTVGPDAQAVIVELGANDMLRGLAPALARSALDSILARLKERRLPVLVAGMRAAPNLGPEYGKTFNEIYPDLAAKYGFDLYPFFLDGSAGDASLTQADGLHPNARGVDVIVSRILPSVEKLVKR